MVFLFLARGGALVCLQCVPVVDNVLSPLELGITENMRVSQDELLRNTGGDIVDSKVPLLGSDGRVKDNLQEEITQFFLQIRSVTCRIGLMDCVKGFVRLFEQILG